MKHNDSITFSSEELKRLNIVNKVINRALTHTEAAQILSLSTRQISRIVKRVKTEGHRGIIHKLKEKSSNHGYSELTRDRVIKLFRDKYNHLSITEAAQKLTEVDHITIHRETLRIWLIKSGDWKNNGKKKSNVTGIAREKSIRQRNKVKSQKITVKNKRDGNSPQKSEKIYKVIEKQEDVDFTIAPKRKYIPAPDHPWRRLIYPQYADKYRREG